MKTIALPTFFALGILSLAFSASAQGMTGPSMMGVQESAGIASALSELYQSQGVSAQDEINCASVTEAQLEELGDAYMESIHPGDAHEYMDQMMGGEGSESLRKAHIAMGRAYLGCWSGEQGNGFAMPMMGGHGNQMMGGYYGGGMMSGLGLGLGYGWLGTLTILTWLAAGLLLCLVLIRKLNQK